MKEVLVPVASTELEFNIRSGNEQEVLKQIQDAGLIKSFRSDSLQLTPSEFIDILVCIDDIVLVFMIACFNGRDEIALPFSITRKMIELNAEFNSFLYLLEEKLDVLRRTANKPQSLPEC